MEPLGCVITNHLGDFLVRVLSSLGFTVYHSKTHNYEFSVSHFPLVHKISSTIESGTAVRSGSNFSIFFAVAVRFSENIFIWKVIP